VHSQIFTVSVILPSKRQLNQAVSVLSLSLVFSVSIVLLTRANFCIMLNFVFCFLVVLVRLLVPVQVIDWKDLSPT